MRRLSWCESTTATAPPRIRVERFCGKARHRVHLLGEVKRKKVHFRFGENTMPCLAPGESCPFCTDATWKKRDEFFGPALVMNTKDKLWVPIVAVFTQGGFNKMNAAPAGPMRGRVLDVYRQTQGTSVILVVKELARIDPIVPAFDIDPHLLRVWFPGDDYTATADVPPAVPFSEEAAPAVEPAAEPTKLTPSQLAEAMETWRRMRAEREEAAPVPAAKPAAVVVEPAVAQAPPPANQSGPAELADVVGRLIPGVNAQFGPRIQVRGATTPDDEAEVLRAAMSKGTGADACDYQRARSAHLNGNGKVKGGAL